MANKLMLDKNITILSQENEIDNIVWKITVN